MANQQGQAFEDLRNTVTECTRIIRLRWRLALVGLSLVASVAFWCSQYLPREYSSSTMFERRDDVVLQNLISSNSPYGFDHLKTTIHMDMTGSRALARACEEGGLLPAGTFTSEAALTDEERGALDSVIGRYELEPQIRFIHSTPSLDTIKLSCTSNDPEIARRMVVALRDSYISDTRDRIRDILLGTREFFVSEIGRLEDQVSRVETDLRQGFDEFPSVDPTDLAGVGNRLEMMRAQRDELYQRKAALEADIQAREQFLMAAPDPYEPDEGEGAVATKQQPLLPATKTVNTTLDRAVEQVQQEIVDLLTVRRMTLEHPDVKALYHRLDTLQELRTALLESTPVETVADVEVMGPEPIEPPKVSEAFRQWQAQQRRVELELESLMRQLNVAETQLAEADRRLERFESLYNRLVEEDDNLRRLIDQRSESSAELAVWQGHLSRLERVLAAESGQRGTQFTLLEEPADVVRPSKPRVASVFVVCSGLGLAAAALLVALMELFDRSFRSVSQVTRSLGVPVLECIAVVPTPRERRRALMSRMIWAPTLTILVVALVGTASLAYASLEMPGMHARTMQRVDKVLDAVGIAALSPMNETDDAM